MELLNSLHHMIEAIAALPDQIVVYGLGVAVLVGMVSLLWPQKFR